MRPGPPGSGIRVGGVPLVEYVSRLVAEEAAARERQKVSGGACRTCNGARWIRPTRRAKPTRVRCPKCRGVA